MNNKNHNVTLYILSDKLLDNKTFFLFIFNMWDPVPSRAAAVLRHKRHPCFRGSTVQRVAVRHGEKRGDSGVPPERRCRGVPDGSALLRAPQHRGRGNRPRRGAVPGLYLTLGFTLSLGFTLPNTFSSVLNVFSVGSGWRRTLVFSSDRKWVGCHDCMYVSARDCRKNMDQMPVASPTECPWACEKRLEEAELELTGVSGSVAANRGMLFYSWLLHHWFLCFRCDQSRNLELYFSRVFYLTCPWFCLCTSMYVALDKSVC